MNIKYFVTSVMAITSLLSCVPQNGNSKKKVKSQDDLSLSQSQGASGAEQSASNNSYGFFDNRAAGIARVTSNEVSVNDGNSRFQVSSQGVSVTGGSQAAIGCNGDDLFNLNKDLGDCKQNILVVQKNILVCPPGTILHHNVCINVSRSADVSQNRFSGCNVGYEAAINVSNNQYYCRRITYGNAPVNNSASSISNPPVNNSETASNSSPFEETFLDDLDNQIADTNSDDNPFDNSVEEASAVIAEESQVTNTNVMLSGGNMTVSFSNVLPNESILNYNFPLINDAKTRDLLYGRYKNTGKKIKVCLDLLTLSQVESGQKFPSSAHYCDTTMAGVYREGDFSKNLNGFFALDSSLTWSEALDLGINRWVYRRVNDEWLVPGGVIVQQAGLYRVTVVSYGESNDSPIKGVSNDLLVRPYEAQIDNNDSS